MYLGTRTHGFYAAGALLLPLWTVFIQLSVAVCDDCLLAQVSTASYQGGQ